GSSGARAPEANWRRSPGEPNGLASAVSPVRPWSIPPWTRSVEAAARSVPAAATVSGTPESAGGRWAERGARTGCGRRDHDATIRLDADGLGAHALLLLDREVNDAALVREHRLERDRGARRLHPRRDA